MLPMPVLLSIPGPSEGCQITGRMVRVMMFHSSLTEIGITGYGKNAHMIRVGASRSGDRLGKVLYPKLSLIFCKELCHLIFLRPSSSCYCQDSCWYCWVM